MLDGAHGRFGNLEKIKINTRIVITYPNAGAFGEEGYIHSYYPGHKMLYYIKLDAENSPRPLLFHEYQFKVVE